jgi:hypothetical protein
VEFISGLFNDAVSSAESVAFRDRMVNEQRIVKDVDLNRCNVI